MGDRTTKIALIGATGYEYSSPEARIDCFPWDRLKKVANLADYDVVILDLLSLQGPEHLDVGAFRKMLDIRTAQQVLSKEDGFICVLGDPRFTIEWESARARHTEPFLGWTGVEFVWDDRPGTTVERSFEAEHGVLKRFADKLVRWDYSLVECRPYLEEYGKVWDLEAMQRTDQQPGVALNKTCWNRYGNALVFSVRHAVEGFAGGIAARRLRTRVTEALSGPMLFLPRSELSEEDTLELVLRDLCEVDVSAPAPEWVSEFVAPGQDRVDREIESTRARIEELIEEHDRKVEERDKIREPLKLLYETGGALEEVVRAVLVALGAEVSPGEDRTNEDGWITVQVGDETFEGVLEIKGVKGEHFNLEGVRQLTDWIDRGITLRKKKYRGIFVGNSSREDPPRRRKWPFHKNWVDYAEMRGYAGIRSEDLYVLYLLDQTGRLDRAMFWRGLFSTRGPFDMRPFWEDLSEEEKEQLSGLP